MVISFWWKGYEHVVAKWIEVKLSDIMMNIDKLKVRYPQDLDSDKSLHRKEGDI